jgi:hypothetical protein
MSGGFYPNQAVGVEIEAWEKIHHRSHWYSEDKILRREKISKKRAVFGWELGYHLGLGISRFGQSAVTNPPSSGHQRPHFTLKSRLLARCLQMIWPEFGHKALLRGIFTTGNSQPCGDSTGRLAVPTVKWLLSLPASPGIDFDGHSCLVSIIEGNLFA